MNTTQSVDEHLAQRAPEAVQDMGKRLNQPVRDDLEPQADSAQRQQQWAQFEASCLESTATLDGWQFDRNEANRNTGSRPGRCGS